MRNIKLTIAFDGTEFSGWQRQSHALTIQGELEKALSRITNAPVTLHGAGRTDAGVHALAMVASFQTTSPVSTATLHKALNSILPSAIRIFHIEEMGLEFHARFSSISKTYFYIVETGSIQSPTNRLYAVHIPQDLAIEPMQQCLEFITGTHDFASFEASGSRDKSIVTGRGSIRTLQEAALHKTGNNELQFVFTGDGFLRHMVRNIVGTVLEVGKGRKTVEEFKIILEAKDRAVACATAPAHGLFLKKIYYS